MEDLTAASVDDVKAFFRTYYAPGQRDAGDRRRLRSRQDQGSSSSSTSARSRRASRSRAGPRPRCGSAASSGSRWRRRSSSRSSTSRIRRPRTSRRAIASWTCSATVLGRRQVVAPLQAPRLRDEDRAVGDRRAAEPAARVQLRDHRLADARAHARRDPRRHRRGDRRAAGEAGRRAPSSSARRTSSSRTPSAASRACSRAPSACRRTTTWPAIPASSTEDLRRYRAVDAAAIQRAAQQYLRKDARVVVTIDPNPDAPIMGRIKK